MHTEKSRAKQEKLEQEVSDMEKSVKDMSAGEVIQPRTRFTKVETESAEPIPAVTDDKPSDQAPVDAIASTDQAPQPEAESAQAEEAPKEALQPEPQQPVAPKKRYNMIPQPRFNQVTRRLKMTESVVNQLKEQNTLLVQQLQQLLDPQGAAAQNTVTPQMLQQMQADMYTRIVKEQDFREANRALRTSLTKMKDDGITIPEDIDDQLADIVDANGWVGGDPHEVLPNALAIWMKENVEEIQEQQNNPAPRSAAQIAQEKRDAGKAAASVSAAPQSKSASPKNSGKEPWENFQLDESLPIEEQVKRIEAVLPKRKGTGVTNLYI